jgi:hypothetical protein
LLQRRYEAIAIAAIFAAVFGHQVQDKVARFISNKVCIAKRSHFISVKLIQNQVLQFRMLSYNKSFLHLKGDDGPWRSNMIFKRAKSEL